MFQCLLVVVQRASVQGTHFSSGLLGGGGFGCIIVVIDRKFITNKHSYNTIDNSTVYVLFFFNTFVAMSEHFWLACLRTCAAVLLYFSKP